VPASLRIEIHHDFAVLERRLEELLRALKAEHGPLAPAAVVVPTVRLMTHLQERLAGRDGALLEVHFFHHDGFAAAAAAAGAAGGALETAFPRPLGDAAREAILARTVARRGGAMARWLDAVPPGAGALLATLDDLREAGVPPDAARRVAGLSDEGRTLLALHADYCAALDRLRHRGFADRAGRIAACLPHVPRFTSRFRLLVHYGASEIVGMNLDLMRAAQAAEVPTVYLAPGHPDAPAFAYARGFWREAFAIEPVLLPDPPAPVPSPSGVGDGGDHLLDADGAADRRLLGTSLPLLYDEERGSRTAEVRFFHAQGSTGELREAALRVLGEHAAHATPAHRIGILARSLEPYASRLADLAGTHALPLTTSATTPLRMEGAALAATRLLRAVLLDFPAQPLLDLVRGGRLIPPPGTDPAAGVDAWERIVRHARVEGGLDTLTRDLPRWIEEDPPRPARRLPAGGAQETAKRRALVAAAVHLARLVRALERDASSLRSSGGWPDFAAAARRLLEARVAGFADGEEADPGTRGVLAALDDLEALGAAEVPFESPAEALVMLERAVAAGRVPLAALAADAEALEADEGGVRVFDTMQARGLSFDTVILLGLNAGHSPRPVRPDPFLGDADRARLRAALGRPVPIKEAARLEEHLLLALTLGSARHRLVVGWQRADDAGRALSPSLALREIARVTRGSPDLAGLLENAFRVPGDLREWEGDGARTGAPSAGAAPEATPPRLLARREAMLAAAMAAGSPASLLRRLRALAPMLSDDPEALAAGLEFLRAIESPEDRGFDTLVGPPEAPVVAASGGAPPEPPRPWSPSRLEQLGSCPQRFFFRHHLGVEEWQEPAAAHEIDPREIGSAVHEVLARVYAGAQASGELPLPGDIDDQVRAAWRLATTRIAGRLDPLYPGLWEQVGGAWGEAIVRFVRRDLDRLLAQVTSLACEAEVEATLSLPDRSEPVRVAGRFDRLAWRTDGAVVVADYKTGRGLEDFVAPLEFLKGRRLQMPLYALMAEAGRWSGQPIAAGRAAVAVEVVGVGPRHERAPEEALARLDAKSFAPVREGFLETLAILLSLDDAGLYPLNETSPLCTWCDFRRACRRGHGATLERLAANPALRDYALLRRKSTRATRLAEIRGGAVNGEER
jgi:RecB family exonuclease